MFLASEQAEYVNGQVFHQRAGELSLYGMPQPVRMVHHNGGWTPELIDEVAMPALSNQFSPIENARLQHPGMPLE